MENSRTDIRWERLIRETTDENTGLETEMLFFVDLMKNFYINKDMLKILGRILKYVSEI